MVDNPFILAKRIVFSVSDEHQGLPQKLINEMVGRWMDFYSAELRELGQIAHRAVKYFKHTKDIASARSGVVSDVMLILSPNAKRLVLHFPELRRIFAEVHSLKDKDFLRHMEEFEKAFA